MFYLLYLQYADLAACYPILNLFQYQTVRVGMALFTALIVAVGRQKNEEVSGTFSQLENVWSKYNIFGKTEDES